MNSRLMKRGYQILLYYAVLTVEASFWERYVRKMTRHTVRSEDPRDGLIRPKIFRSSIDIRCIRRCMRNVTQRKQSADVKRSPCAPFGTLMSFTQPLGFARVSPNLIVDANMKPAFEEKVPVDVAAFPRCQGPSSYIPCGARSERSFTLSVKGVRVPKSAQGDL